MSATSDNFKIEDIGDIELTGCTADRLAEIEANWNYKAAEHWHIPGHCKLCKNIEWLIAEAKRLREMRQQDQHVITSQAQRIRDLVSECNAEKGYVRMYRDAYCKLVSDQRTAASAQQQRPTD